MTENRSLDLAKTAKSLLEAVGWQCKGRAWAPARTEAGAAELAAEIIATRGEETLILQWEDGKPTVADYSLWNTHHMADNTMPTPRLKFDPNDLSDAELARRLSGMRVEWWNKLAGAVMTGTVSGQKIKIERTYNARGIESPADRIVQFNDAGDGGFRAFRVNALLKVGN